MANSLRASSPQPHLTRRALLRGAAAASLGAAAGPFLNLGSFPLFAGSPTRYSARAVQLVERSLVIDMLNPFSLPSLFRLPGRNWFEDPASFTDADLAHLRASGHTVLHVAGGVQQYDDVVRFHLLWNGFIAHHSDTFARIDDIEGLERIKKSGKIGIILGVQDSVHFRTVEDADLFYRYGQRVSQLTYNARNLLGNGCTERRDDGLSDFGVAVIGRMDRLGMAVDVSHCGERTTLDAFEVSKRPVLITHSNCRALVPRQPRSKTDEAIRAMAAKGGVMGLTFMRMFVRDSEPTTLEHLLDHVDHIARLVGIEHAGIGSDTDLAGWDALPEDARQAIRGAYKKEIGFREKMDLDEVDSPKRIFDLTEGLIRRGYSDPDIEGVLGGNFQRALTAIWTPSARGAAARAS
ncbi:MAG TPA: membrane dipeptidase [Thermoanaerobaculia bacterium]|nr:membrane dipeptidase [Thermoanaerobaculia bacterium]